MLWVEQLNKEHYQAGKFQSDSETCDVCHGSGISGDGTCSACNGTGTI